MTHRKPKDTQAQVQQQPPKASAAYQMKDCAVKQGNKQSEEKSR